MRRQAPGEFWPTYSAFANSFGGTIVLGLTEDPRDRRRLVPTGVGDPEKIIRDLWDQANNPQKVNVYLLSEDDVRIEDEDGRRLVEVTVPRAERRKRPVYINESMNSGTYRRNGEGDYHCSVTEVAEMLRDSREELMDSALCTEVLVRDLDRETIDSYRTMMANIGGGASLEQGAAGRVPQAHRDSPFRRDRDAETDDSGRPHVWTRLLHSARTPRVHAGLSRVSRRRERLGLQDDHRHQGMGGKPVRILHVRVQPPELERPVRVDDNDKLRAEREAVLNAIVHADYKGSWGVRVELRPGSLTVRNPGTFHIPVALAERSGHSDPRNRLVMKMFALAGLLERAGSGIYRMVGACRETGLGDSEFTEGIDPATVTVRMAIANIPGTEIGCTGGDRPMVLGFIASRDTARSGRLSRPRSCLLAPCPGGSGS